MEEVEFEKHPEGGADLRVVSETGSKLSLQDLGKHFLC